MKYVGSFSSKLAAYGVALTVTSWMASALAQPQNGSARVQAIRGTAEYSEAGGAYKKLAVGKVLSSGSSVRTAVNSQVDLFLKQNGPVVRVTADTTLALDKLLFEEPPGGEAVIETQLNLSNGRILGNVKKLAALSKYEVKIPTGTVGIRGTEYDISANGKVTINEGSAVVTLTGPGAVPTTVNQGQTFNPPTAPNQPGTVANLTPGEAGILNRIFKDPDGVENVSVREGGPGGPKVILAAKPKGEKTDSDTLAPPSSNPKKGFTSTATVIVGQPDATGHATITIFNPDGSKLVVTGTVSGPPGNLTVTIPKHEDLGKIPVPKPGEGSSSTIIPLPTKPGGEPEVVTTTGNP